MLLPFLIIALALQGLPKEFLDKRVLEGKEQTGTALDELTMGHLLRLVAMPHARLSKIQCVGYGIWLRRNGHPALADERLDAVHASLGQDAARFGEMKGEIGHAFVALYAENAADKEKEMTPTEFEQWRRSEDARCGDFFKMAGDGSLKLRPLAPASVIDPVLNGCHASYRTAAARKTGKEALSLARLADRAATLALEGKSGAALIAARAALEEEAADALTAPVLGAEPETMQLTLCVSRLKRAAEQ